MTQCSSHAQRMNNAQRPAISSVAQDLPLETIVRLAQGVTCLLGSLDEFVEGETMMR